MRSTASSATGGFTLIELLIVVVIIGVLAAIAIPNFSKVVYRARAADILSDAHTVQLAYSQYLADGNARPRNSGWGTVPVDLAPYLPEGFSFRTDEADYRWVRLRARASPWNAESGDFRVRPKARWRKLMLDNLEAMANKATTLRTANHIRIYMAP